MKNPKSISDRQKFIASAKNSKILTRKCKDCSTIMLATILYCEKCHGKNFKLIEYPGSGYVTTFTIHTVPPEGFEDVDSYAWVVFTLDDILVRASGFLPHIKKPSDLPIGSKVNVQGFDEKHGLVLKKL
ncbi:MAG: Zn-ribbon domain-containing OB-fold protein [Nitrososphaeraceae archaeon]